MDEKILRELLSITRENNEILRNLNRQRKWTNFFFIFKWLVFVAIAYSAYLATKPYIDKAQQTYNQIQDLNSQVKSIQNIDQKSFTNFLQNEFKKRIGN